MLKFTNLRACDGTIESYLFLDGGLLRLSLLPQRLRQMSQKELVKTLYSLRFHGELQSGRFDPRRQSLEPELSALLES